MNRRTKRVVDLANLFSSAPSRKELADLLEELLTPAEKKDLVQRWKVVELLLEGRSQRKIQKQLKISIQKVTRGSHVLQKGSGILEKVYRRLRKEDKNTP